MGASNDGLRQRLYVATVSQSRTRFLTEDVPSTTEVPLEFAVWPFSVHELRWEQLPSGG
jgi:hypothetical protein